MFGFFEFFWAILAVIVGNYLYDWAKDKEKKDKK